MTKRIGTMLSPRFAQGLKAFLITAALASSAVVQAGAPPEIMSQLGDDPRPQAHLNSSRSTVHSASQSPSQMTGQPATCNKRFKKALIISGGGITPGVALGLIAGAKASGNKPDVILATCGGSIGAAIANAYPDPQEAKKFAMSCKFHKYLQDYTRVGKTSAVGVGLKLGEAAVNPGDVPDMFDRNIIDIPTTLPRLLDNETYRSGKNDTRLITVAARALYKQSDAKQKIANQSLYEQTFFTDKDTAKSLKDTPASMRKNFPDSPIHPWTTTRTDVSTIQAARASISDPFMINPAKIGKDYYFGGAMDLYPIETAQKIACETLATTPADELTGIEDMAVKRGFGFSQKERVSQLKGYKGLRWAQMKGAEKLKMDPDVDGVDTNFTTHIPADCGEFAALIEKQYEFGYQQAMAAYENPGSQTPAKVRSNKNVR